MQTVIISVLRAWLLTYGHLLPVAIHSHTTRISSRMVIVRILPGTTVGMEWRFVQSQNSHTYTFLTPTHMQFSARDIRKVFTPGEFTWRIMTHDKSTNPVSEVFYLDESGDSFKKVPVPSGMSAIGAFESTKVTGGYKKFVLNFHNTKQSFVFEKISPATVKLISITSC